MDVYKTVSFLFPWFTIYKRKLDCVEDLKYHNMNDIMRGFMENPKTVLCRRRSVCYGNVGDKHVWMKISWPANLLSIKTPVRFLGFPLFYRGLLFRFFAANRVIPGTNMFVWKCYDAKEKPYVERIKERNEMAVKEVLG